MPLHPLILTATDDELGFIARLDYGQGEARHLAALRELIFERGGCYQDSHRWFPYEVLELGANSPKPGHEREFTICMLMVIHAVHSGFDCWTDLDMKLSQAMDALAPITSPWIELLMEEYWRGAA